MVWIQIVADLALLLAIVFLVWAVSRERKKDPAGIDAKTLAEFKQLIEESQRSSDHLFQALEEVRELVSDLDAKERRLKALVAQQDAENRGRDSKAPSRAEKYEDVVKMSRHGASVREIADLLSLTEGEIALILELHRKKNENSTHRSNTP